MVAEDTIKRTLQIDMEVGQLKPAVESVQGFVEGAGGFIQSQYYTTKTHARIVCHVPSTQRVAFSNQVKSLGMLLNESMEAEDLSNDMNNVEAELENLYQLRARLKGLLEKTDKVEEILSIERELNRVQARIDYLEKTERSQQKSVTYASYTLSLKEKDADRIYGPLGLLVYGTYWVVEKLFVIR